MTKKATQTTKPQVTKPESTPATPEAQPTTGPILTPELRAKLRAADTLEAAFDLLVPHATRKPKVDQQYVVNEQCLEPLPQVRGASNKIAAVAERLGRPFTIADIAAALPNQKAIPYWVRRMATLGHFTEVQ